MGRGAIMLVFVIILLIAFSIDLLVFLVEKILEWVDNRPIKIKDIFKLVISFTAIFTFAYMLAFVYL